MKTAPQRAAAIRGAKFGKLSGAKSTRISRKKIPVSRRINVRRIENGVV
jgi:hypothetical protein